MNIHPIQKNKLSFNGFEAKTDAGNSYDMSYKGKALGLSAGLILSGGLMYSQIVSIKTFEGKRSLVESFQERGKSLNDIIAKTVEKDEAGKIIPTVSKISNRANKIFNRFKAQLSLSCLGLTVLATGVGHLLDMNNNLLRARKADDKDFAKSLER